MTHPHIGLLPLYLELYDNTLPERRSGVERFRDTIEAELRRRGLRVTLAPICRLEREFEEAVAAFETAGVDAIVTLHLAYSPSEESAPVLARTRLPIIVLDTTPAADFGPQQDPDQIMYNHGIHGVQDLCNLLIRCNKPFHIEVGHWERSDVLDRVARRARSAQLAGAMRRAHVGRIGHPFKGMGDFAVPVEVMSSSIGIQTVPASPEQIAALAREVSEAEIDAECRDDLARLEAGSFSADAHRRTARVSLAVRRWIEQERLTAFTVNFMEVSRASGFPTMPFLEASKAMGRGIGYAGEGDVLTAALVGALASTLGETSFTEMFCPDWTGDSVFLSHMGEMNLALAAETPRLVERSFAFIDTDPFVLAYGRFRAGEAVLVNLAPGPGHTFTLIVAPVSILPVAGQDRMADSIHGWFKPRLPLADFLAEYSRLGGTHHCALVYGEVADLVGGFGEWMGWQAKTLA